jgi:hypothetical protein
VGGGRGVSIKKEKKRDLSFLRGKPVQAFGQQKKNEMSDNQIGRWSIRGRDKIVPKTRK